MEVPKITTYTPTWGDLIRCLGLPETGIAFPLQTACPLCLTGKLTIYQDTRHDSHWHQCAGCKSNGDMITLAAKFWEISRIAAASRLANELDAPHIPQRDDQEPEIEERVQDLWKIASARLTVQGAANIATILRRYRLSLDLDPVRQAAGPATLYGVVPFGWAMGAFYASTPWQETLTQRKYRRTVKLADRCAHYESGTQRAPLFPGKGWGDLLTIPYFDRPGRVRGLLFVGRQGDPNDFRFRRVPDTSKEFGLAGLPAVEASNRVLGDYVIALDDPLRMLRLQTRHFGVATRPLPLVAWHDSIYGATLTAWDSLADKQVVFWTFRPDARVVRQVSLMNGLLAIAGPDDACPAQIDNFICAQSPKDLCKDLIRRAKPWREALSLWARQDPIGFEEMIAELETTDANRILRACDIDLHELTDFLPRTDAIRTVTFNATNTVTEYPDGRWIAGTTSTNCRNRQRTGSVSNVAIRIEEIFTGPPVIYRGHLLFEGQRIPFTCEKEIADKDPFRFVDRVLIESRKGIAHVESLWKKRLIDVAMKFCRPDIKSGTPTP